MIGVCLSARAVELDKEAQQLHRVSLDIYIGELMFLAQPERWWWWWEITCQTANRKRCVISSILKSLYLLFFKVSSFIIGVL